MIKDIPIRFILLLILVFTGVFPLMIMGIFNLTTAKSELKNQVFRQLESVRNLKKDQIEFFYETFQKELPLIAIDRIMNERSGMGKSGETYLVGPDFKLRSDSYLDPLNRSVQASLNGSVAKNGVNTLAVRRALSGQTGTDILLDYRGISVLSAYAPVKVNKDETWAILAEIDEDEIDQITGDTLNTQLIVIFLLSLLFSILISFLISIFISSRIKNIIDELENITEAVVGGNLDAKGEINRTSVDFRRVIANINKLIETFKKQSDEKRKLEAAIEYNQKIEAIGTLAGGIAHDFNNILAYLMVYTDLVLEEITLPSPTSDNVLEIKNGIKRASELVSQIFTFSRLVENEKSAFLVNVIIKEAIKLIKATLPKHIEIKKFVQSEDIYIKAGPAQIYQVVMNLCTNAFHAMQEDGGTLFVSLKEVEIKDKSGNPIHYCELIVKDHGMGIPPDIRHRIFDPFFTTKPVGKGTGMGLSVVQATIKQLNGYIQIDSTVGEGTQVRVLIPVSSKTGSKQQDETIVSAIESARILFIDDEEMVCKSNKQALEKMGYSVVTISDPLQVEQMLVEGNVNFDLVISDINMPKIDGIKLARKIKQSLPKMPILLISGYSDQTNLLSIKKIGLQGLLSKPYNTVALSHAVFNALTNK